jgi:processing peptidase subunit beta
MTAQLSHLPNGLRVATREMPHATTVSIGIWVNAGARDETAKEQGIAHMLEHMAFKGTKRRDAQAIATEVENVGGFINAHTSREETAYYLRLLPEHIDLGIDILTDILTQSTLPDVEIERERGVIIQEIGQSLDTPDDLVFDLFAKACHDNHNLGRPILGTVDSVSNFQRADLRGFMNRFYGAGQMIVVASGAVRHDDIVSRIDASLGSLSDAKTAKRLPPIWSAGRQIATRDLEQSHIVFGLPTKAATAPDRFALMALSTLYGGGMSSRLFQQVREQRGLCYSIFSFASLYSDNGVFSVYAGTSASQANEMLTVAAGELASIAKSVHPDEVTRAKAQLRASLLMSRESASNCGDAVARQIMLFGAPQDDAMLLAAIDDVDVNAVRDMAAHLISGNRPALACVGPPTQLIDNDDLAARLTA